MLSAKKDSWPQTSSIAEPLMGRREETVRLSEYVLSACPFHYNTRWQGMSCTSRPAFFTPAMRRGAVCAASQNPKIVSIRPAEAKGSHAMFAIKQRWYGVVTTNEKKRISTHCERAVVRDTLTREHRPRTAHRKCCRNRMNQGIGSKTF